MQFDLFDVVKLKKDVPEDNLTSGMLGTIVYLLQGPYLAYEVEFVDDDGETLAVATLRPDEIELVKKHRESPSR